MRCPMTLRCAVLLAVVYSVASCGREQSIDTSAGTVTAGKNQNGSMVTSRDGPVTIAGNEDAGRIAITTGLGEDVAVSYVANTLGEGFPVDIPVYEPAQILMSQVFNGGRNAVLTLTTSHVPERVADYYRAELVNRGWSVGGEMHVGGMLMLQGRKNGYALNFTVLTVEGSTKINIAKTEADE